MVVLGIVTALAGALFPVLVSVRRSARDAVCAGRLRELALAANLYLSDNGIYPEPAHGASGSSLLSLPVYLSASSKPPLAPDAVQTRLLNDLSAYLRLQKLTGSAPAQDLSPSVQCPEVESDSDGRGPFLTGDLTHEFYYTGYAYVARLTDAPNLKLGLNINLGTLVGLLTKNPNLGLVLKPQRTTGARQLSRTTLWADEVQYASDGTGWRYAHGHASGAATPGGCRGQHRAYTDGTVEWIGAGGLELPKDGSAQPAATASYQLGPSLWWWY